jgi:hypothetical protein
MTKKLLETSVGVTAALPTAANKSLNTSCVLTFLLLLLNFL